MGFGGDAGQITPESMSQPDAADALVKMLLLGVPTMPGGAGAASGIGAAGPTGTAGAAGIGGSTLAGAPGLDAFSASPVTSSSFDLMGTMFPKPQNGFYSGLGSALGVQNPTATGILNTIDRIKASPLHSEGIPGEGEPLQMPQLGGVTLPKRRTSGRMF